METKNIYSKQHLKTTSLALAVATLLALPTASHADFFDNIVSGVTDAVTDNVTDRVIKKADKTTDDVFEGAEESIKNSNKPSSSKNKRDEEMQKPVHDSVDKLEKTVSSEEFQNNAKATNDAFDKLNNASEDELIDGLNIPQESKMMMRDLKTVVSMDEADGPKGNESPAEKIARFKKMKKQYAKPWKAFLAKYDQPKNTPYECLNWAFSTSEMEMMLREQSYSEVKENMNNRVLGRIYNKFYEDQNSKTDALYPAGSAGHNLVTDLIKKATQKVPNKKLSQIALGACKKDKSLQLRL